LSGALSGIDYAILGAFEIIAQPTPNTCCAAVFMMMYCWKNTRSTDIPSALATAGGSFLDLYKHDMPLDGATTQSLYEAAGYTFPTRIRRPQPRTSSCDGRATRTERSGP
jgi:hypothetical protein